jgi:hypothetical protein
MPSISDTLKYQLMIVGALVAIVIISAIPSLTVHKKTVQVPSAHIIADAKEALHKYELACQDSTSSFALLHCAQALAILETLQHLYPLNSLKHILGYDVEELKESLLQLQNNTLLQARNDLDGQQQGARKPIRLPVSGGRVRDSDDEENLAQRPFARSIPPPQSAQSPVSSSAVVSPPRPVSLARKH